MASVTNLITLPEPFASLDRATLTFGPSPIHILPNLTKHLASTGENRIYAKREDVNSALAYGGNKTRKLEYLLPDALNKGATHLISIGGIQSNHTRQVAAVAAASNLKSKLIHVHWAVWENQHYADVGNNQLSGLIGAQRIMDGHDCRIADTDEDAPAVKKVLDEIRSAGGLPYWIPAGASMHPLGGLGFARWAYEVAQQETAMGVFFDTVIVCAVTGSTFGGMIAGFKLLEKQGGKKRKVIGIDASAEPQQTFADVLKIAKFTAAKIGLSEDDITERDVLLDTRYCGPAYGVPDKQCLDAIKLGAALDAFITDPVYEGKSLAGMVDMIQRGEIKDSNVLYAHLGGQLALNSYTDMGEKIEGTSA